MILVDIYVPAVEQIYDFSLDEHCKIGSLLEEIQEMVCQKEHCEGTEDISRLSLCSKEQRRMLNHDSTLAENGIHNGSMLIMV